LLNSEKFKGGQLGQRTRTIAVCRKMPMTIINPISNSW